MKLSVQLRQFFLVFSWAHYKIRAGVLNIARVRLLDFFCIIPSAVTKGSIIHEQGFSPVIFGAKMLVALC